MRETEVIQNFTINRFSLFGAVENPVFTDIRVMTETTETADNQTFHSLPNNNNRKYDADEDAEPKRVKRPV